MMGTSVQKWHSRVLLQDLLRSRVWKMHREPEVLEAEAQVGKWLDCRARIISKETCTNSFCEKRHPPECLFYKTKSCCRFGMSVRMHIDKLKNRLAKGLKECWQKCNGYVEEEWASSQNRETCFGCVLINYTTIGLRVPGYEAAEVFIDFTEELRHTETDPMCKIHKSRCTSLWPSRPKTIARIYLPRWSSSAQSQFSKIWGSISGRDRVARAMCPWNSVEAGQKYL